MATQSRVPGAASSEVDFELERFERTTADRIEISGRWFGLRGRRFVRPVLNLHTAGGSRRRAIALLEHKPWAADDGQTWLVAFAWPQGAGDVRGAELEEEMLAAAEELRFEYAAKLRDEIRQLRRELQEATAPS